MQTLNVNIALSRRARFNSIQNVAIFRGDVRETVFGKKGRNFSKHTIIAKRNILTA